MHALYVFHHVEDQYYYWHIPRSKEESIEIIGDKQIKHYLPFVQWLFERSIVQ